MLVWQAWTLNILSIMQKEKYKVVEKFPTDLTVDYESRSYE